MNTTCPVQYAPEDPTPLIVNGELKLQLRHIGWIVSGCFTFVATSVSFWLIWKHLSHYTHPLQQRNIVRLLFMVPVYALASWMSYLWYRHAIYFQTVRDCYEAIVIVSFFNLLLQYVGDTPAQQQAVFKTIRLKKWFWPLGRWKYRPKSGLDFLWIMKVTILQYAICLPACTITALILEALGLYCESSYMPWFGHLWVSIVYNISITIAMYCLIVFYLSIADQVKPYKALLKLCALKAVVFLCFWQGELISLLVSFGAITPSIYTTPDELTNEIAALVLTIEMACFALLHLKAFPYSVYRPSDGEKTQKWRAIADVADYRDLFTQMKDSSRFVYRKARGKSATQVDEIRAQKLRHFEKVMGKSRVGDLDGSEQRNSSEDIEGGRETEDDWKRKEEDALTRLHHFEKAIRDDNFDEDEEEERKTGSNLPSSYPLYETLYNVPQIEDVARGPVTRTWWNKISPLRVFQGYRPPGLQSEEGTSVDLRRQIEAADVEQMSQVSERKTFHTEDVAWRSPLLEPSALGGSMMSRQSPLDGIIAGTRRSSIPMLWNARPMTEHLSTFDKGRLPRLEREGLPNNRDQAASQHALTGSEQDDQDEGPPMTSEVVQFEPAPHSSEAASRIEHSQMPAPSPLDRHGQALRANDPRGKSIQLTLPHPLSPARYPHSNGHPSEVQVDDNSNHPASSRRVDTSDQWASSSGSAGQATSAFAVQLRGETTYDRWSGEPTRRSPS